MTRVIVRTVALADGTQAAAALQAQGPGGAGLVLGGGPRRSGRRAGGRQGQGPPGGDGPDGGGDPPVPPVPTVPPEPQGPPVPPDGGGGGGGGPPDGPGGDGGTGGGNPAQLVPLVDTPWVQVLRRILIPEAAIRFIVIDDGVDNHEELIPLSKESVDQLFSRMDTKGIIYSTVASNRFRLLHHYVRRLTFSGLTIVLNDINVDVLKNEALILQAEPPESAKSKIPLPSKFTDDKSWTTFRSALSNYLKSVRGAGQVPLVYLIRADTGALVGEVVESAVANAPLNGPMYEADNRRPNSPTRVREKQL